MKKVLRLWDSIPILLISAFLTFLLSCSSFGGDGDGSIKIKFDSRLLQQITASRSALSDAEKAGEVYYYQISAAVSGDYSDSALRTLSSSEMNAVENISVSFSKVPVGSNVTVSLSLNRVQTYQGQYEAANTPIAIYSGSQNLTVSSGTNNVVISMKNATAPYFTKTTKSGFVKENPDGTEVNLYATVVAPESSYNYYTLSTAQTTSFNAFKYNASESDSFNSADLLSKFGTYWKDYANGTNKDSVTGGSETYKKTYDGYTFYNVGNTNSSSNDGNGGEFSFEQSYSPYALSGTLTMGNDEEEISAYYTGWIVVYTNPLGEEKYLLSDIAKFTVVDEETEFSIDSVTYNASTGLNYELIDSFSKDNFKIIEDWDGIKIEGDIVNYSEAFEDFPSNYIGEKEFEFSRNDCDPKTCKVTFKYKIPDFSGFSLANDNGTISIASTDSTKSSLYQIVSSPDNLPAYLLAGDSDTYTHGYTITYNWSKNGASLGENFQSYATLATSELTDDGKGTFSLNVTVAPTDDLKEYCVNAESKNYDYGSISLGSASANIIDGVPAFSVTSESISNSEITFSDKEVTFIAKFLDETGLPAIDISTSEYRFAWYLNSVPVGTGSTFSFVPATTGYEINNNGGTNVVMLVLTNASDSTKSRSASVTFTFVEAN